ncbi:MAG: Flp1 family type IVb pilin [Lachnospiraceae bacterium]|jgi:competence protein ComGC
MLNKLSLLKNHLYTFCISFKRKVDDDSGIGVIEMILILLVLVGLVIIFKDQITGLARNIFSNINSQAGGV